MTAHIGEDSAENLRPTYLRVEGTTWPHPDDPSGVEWRLRYGTPTREDLLVAASIIHAYRALVDLPIGIRNHRIKTLKEVRDGR